MDYKIKFLSIDPEKTNGETLVPNVHNIWIGEGFIQFSHGNKTVTLVQQHAVLSVEPVINSVFK